MNRPPLSLALASVLTAQVEGSGRPALLAMLHPDFARRLAQPPAAQSMDGAGRSGDSDGTDAEAPEPPDSADSAPVGVVSETARVIPLARVIPRPRAQSDRTRSEQSDPTPAA
jgi:hypothetical protein